MPEASDEAVKRATGRDWGEWLKVLDKAGAKKLAHRDIATMLHEKFGVAPWWSQMVTVGYERARGLREVHETATGFVASVSRTFNVPVEELFAAWNDGKRRARWLNAGKLTVRKATPPKSMRITWPDGASSLEVGFYAKGDSKSSVAVQHSKLKSKSEVAEKKAFWAEALGRLREFLS